MKKRSLLLMICCISLFFLAASPLRADIEIGSRNAILIDAKTGQILYGKSPYDLSSSGDFNKLLAIITALEEFDELPGELTVNGTALLYNTTPPYLGLKDGQTVKFNDMLYAMYLGGYNDAANVIADNLGRTLLDTESKEFQSMTAQEQTNAAEDAFAKLMNRKADELFCPTMKATNPDGHYYDTQQCSANDVAQLIRSAVRNETFRKIFMTPVYTINGNPDAVNNQPADTESIYKKSRDQAGENAKASELPPKPIHNYPYPTEAYPLEATNQTYEIHTNNKLFSGEILYSGITGGCNAYNSSLLSYHSVVYAKNEERSLIAVVMNSPTDNVYDDLQTLLNYGFYQWNAETISDNRLSKMLPENIASRNLIFTGRTDLLLPSAYNIKDLSVAVAYTENGYLSGTITLTLPDEPSAGTIATVSFYEKNTKSVWKPVLKVGGIILGILLIFVLIFFLWQTFGAQSTRRKRRAILRRTRQTAEKQRQKQMESNGEMPADIQRVSEKDTLPGESGKAKRNGKSDNRRRAEELRRKKEAKKRSNRRRIEKNKS